MIRIEVNFKEFFVKTNTSALEACKLSGVNIPRFCYHETLSIAGNCRMCLIEVQNALKPIAACALPVTNNLSILLDTPLVKKARENVMELLLLNHPLDCPICDQGGECDLQDQSKYFGNFKTKFFLNKKSIENKKINPFIDTIMTRCISCTRCVRFDQEILKTEIIGSINRGSLVEISNYTNSFLISSLSGNIIDLCPVGALTSKTYSFKGRPWELKLTKSIDIFDSLGVNLYIHHTENEIFRVVPKLNRFLSTYIISDKSRFFFDSISCQRLNTILRKNKSLDGYRKYGWQFLLNTIFSYILKKEKLLILVNGDCDFESLYYLKLLTFKYGKNFLVKNCDTYNNVLNFYYKSLMNLNDLFKHYKTAIIFIIASKLKTESIILNHKLQFYSKDLKKINFFNFNLKEIFKFFNGRSNTFSKLITQYKSVNFIFGESLFRKGFIFQALEKLLSPLKSTTNYYIIRERCNSEGLFYYNFKRVTSSNNNFSKVHMLVNLEDSLKLTKYYLNNLNRKIIFWFNTHISTTSIYFNYIIPLFSHFEEEQIFLNFTVFPQQTKKVCNNSFFFMRSLKTLLSLLFIKKPFTYFNLFLANTIFTKKILQKEYNINKFYFINLLSFNTYSYINNVPLKFLNLNNYSLKKYCKFSFNLLKGYKLERFNFNNFKYANEEY